MGLDMNLKRKTFLFSSSEAKEIVKALAPIKSINGEKVTEIVENIGYWRKANQIHAWFVDNVQDGVDDCTEYHVERTDLEKLLKIVNTVIESCKIVDGKIEDSSTAKELLPERMGFFFGNYGYGQSYYEDLILTRTILTQALSLGGGEYYYKSSW